LPGPPWATKLAPRRREEQVTIDIDKLTEPELVDLNRRIAERLRFLQQMRAHKQMLAFRIGDRVAFGADGRGTVEGMLTRYNRRSVTVITDDGHQWNVSPALLSRAAAPSAAEPQARPNLVRLKQRP
jgi:hypothetical protein